MELRDCPNLQESRHKKSRTEFAVDIVQMLDAFMNSHPYPAEWHIHEPDCADNDSSLVRGLQPLFANLLFLTVSWFEHFLFLVLFCYNSFSLTSSSFRSAYTSYGLGCSGFAILRKPAISINPAKAHTRTNMRLEKGFSFLLVISSVVQRLSLIHI